MNRRERYKRIMNHQEADRVPIDLGSHVASIHRNSYMKLKKYMQDEGLKNEDKVLDRMVQNVVPDEKLLERLGVDFRWLFPNWVGVKDVRDDIYEDMWGIQWQYMLDAYSVYDSPLKNAKTKLDIENHPWHDPYDPDIWAGLPERGKWLYENTDYILVMDAVKGGLLTKALQIRGYQEFFMDLANNIEFAEALLDKLLDLYKTMYGEVLKRIGPYVDQIYFTDDLGGQSQMMIAPDTYRQIVKPRQKQLFEHIKSVADVNVMYHTDGTVTPVINDIIEIGADILNPIQTSALGMDTDWLKGEFGDRIVFHGAIDVQQMLPFSTPEEVRYDVAKRLHHLAPGGGYILAPCHNIGSDVPPQNVLAMYDAANELNSYPIDVTHVLKPEDLLPYEERMKRRSEGELPSEGGKKVKRPRPKRSRR
ncbi:MAG: uroporphyrinogen decarboxylase family protein [Chloroflexota bacterium]